MDVQPGILRRIATGDASALTECIDTHGPAIWGVARRRIPDEHEAEEAVQDVFAAIWESAGRFDPAKGGEKTFVMTLARRRIIDRARRRRPAAAEMVEDPVRASEAEGRAEELDELARVMESMAALRPIERRVLRLSIHEGMSHSEVSAELDMPLGTVKSHLRRAILRVRELLGVVDDEEATHG